MTITDAALPSPLIDFHNRAVDALVERVNEGRNSRGLICMAPNSGRAALMALAVQRIHSKPERSVLLLAPNRELAGRLAEFVQNQCSCNVEIPASADALRRELSSGVRCVASTLATASLVESDSLPLKSDWIILASGVESGFTGLQMFQLLRLLPDAPMIGISGDPPEVLSDEVRAVFGNRRDADGILASYFPVDLPVYVEQLENPSGSPELLAGEVLRRLGEVPAGCKAVMIGGTSAVSQRWYNSLRELRANVLLKTAESDPFNESWGAFCDRNHPSRLLVLNRLSTRNVIPLVQTIFVFRPLKDDVVTRLATYLRVSYPEKTMARIVFLGFDEPRRASPDEIEFDVMELV